ncbi:MAG: hypothetical protein KKD01_18150 [Proteobacteria bacterium]|nr:hypothetical protein [Pseudomonadota bacterium]MBU1417939.1 hypothetical protein [Pseudomonadota bacterium]MBU1456641.1 hypothetical protein [Pseudomonadota bacterium]
MIFVDSHVHIYDCFDVDLLLDSALKNFQSAAKQHTIAQQTSSYVLLLTECARDNWFQQQLTTFQDSKSKHGAFARRWCVVGSREEDSMVVCRNDSSEDKIHLVAGRQAVTKEKIEVLALFFKKSISNGMSLHETIDAIRQADGIPVLPWGAGKWLGKRGGILKAFLSAQGKSNLFLGDNGGRPQFWPTPNLFDLAEKKGISVLPGSDPLPLPGEAGRVGSFGFYLHGNSSYSDSPTVYLKKALCSAKTTPVPFGRLQKNSMFLFNQLRLRLSI